MSLGSRGQAYLREHFEECSNKSLAGALGMGEKDVQRELLALGLKRVKKDGKSTVDSNELAPVYTAQLGLPSGFASLVKWDYWVSGIAGFVALLVYWLTLAPTVSGEDSGELITAAYTLGVAHPPGYPIWCLLAKLFTFIPIGSIAWRVNFMSAFFAAMAVFVVCLLVIKLTRSRLAGVVGALLMAFSSEFWEQSVIAEVYGLNSFFVALAIFLLVLWYEHRQSKHLLWFALVFGLGLCNHNTIPLLGPVFVAFLLVIDPRFWHRWKLYATCTVIAVACTSIYLYLPLRSATNPAVDWGNPETFETVKDHVSRAQYSFSAEKNPHTAGRFMGQLGAFLKLYMWEFTPWICWLPILGLQPLWKRNRMVLGLLLGVGFMTSIGIIWATNFELDRQSLWLNNVFWIPAYMMAAIGAGVGLSWVQRQKSGQILAVGLGCIAVLSPLLMHYKANDKSHYFYAYAFAGNILMSLEKDAIYFPSADHATFPVMFMQSVEGLRPDISIANKYGYPEESLYTDMPEEIRNTFGKIPSSFEERFIEKWIIEHTDRPVYFTNRRNMSDLPDYRLDEEGLVYAVHRNEDVKSTVDMWDKYNWYTLDPKDTHGELTADSVLADYYYMRGRSWLAEDKGEEGLEAFEITATLGPESKETLNNLGSACAEYGFVEQAIQYYEQCVEISSDYMLARKNLGQVYLNQGNPKTALLHLEEVVTQSPDDLIAIRLSIQCMGEIGWYDEAITRAEFLLSRTPDDASLYKEVGEYYEVGKQNPSLAQRYYAKSLELDPTQLDLVEKVNKGPKDGPELPTLPDPTALAPSVPTPGIPSLPQAPSPGGFGGVPQPPTPGNF